MPAAEAVMDGMCIYIYNAPAGLLEDGMAVQALCDGIEYLGQEFGRRYQMQCRKPYDGDIDADFVTVDGLEEGLILILLRACGPEREVTELEYWLLDNVMDLIGQLLMEHMVEASFTINAVKSMH